MDHRPQVGVMEDPADDCEASVVTLEAAVPATLDVSLDGGRTWTEAGNVPTGVARFDLTRQVKGRTAICADGGRGQAGQAALRSMRIETWVQVAPISLPRLTAGQNRCRYDVGDRYGKQTVPAFVLPNVADPDHLKTFVQEMPSRYDPGQLTSRIQGDVVLKLTSAPGTKIDWFTAGAAFTTHQGPNASRTANRIAYAVGQPREFKEIYDRSYLGGSTTGGTSGTRTCGCRHPPRPSTYAIRASQRSMSCVRRFTRSRPGPLSRRFKSPTATWSATGPSRRLSTSPALATIPLLSKANRRTSSFAWRCRHSSSSVKKEDRDVGCDQLAGKTVALRADVTARQAHQSGPNRWARANRIVVCLRSPSSSFPLTQHSGELVTPYGGQMVHELRTPVLDTTSYKERVMTRNTRPDRIAYLRLHERAVMFRTEIAVAAPPTSPSEPNVEVASAWWPEMENTWVPIGWKDHPLRFNVLYNGTLIAQPVRYPARGQGVQLTFVASRDGKPPASTSSEPYQLRSRDGGVGDQGWTDNASSRPLDALAPGRDRSSPGSIRTLKGRRIAADRSRAALCLDPAVSSRIRHPPMPSC